MVKDVLDDPNSLKEIIIFQHFETVFPKQLSDEWLTKELRNVLYMYGNVWQYVLTVDRCFFPAHDI